MKKSEIQRVVEDCERRLMIQPPKFVIIGSTGRELLESDERYKVRMASRDRALKSLIAYGKRGLAIGE